MSATFTKFLVAMLLFLGFVTVIVFVVLISNSTSPIRRRQPVVLPQPTMTKEPFNPFSEPDDYKNPFATESGEYQNPFAAEEGESPYQNPFTPLR